MNAERAAPAAGVAGSLAVLLALAAPLVLVNEPGTGFPLYYGAGLFGAGAVAALAALAIVTFLAGTRGAADPQTAAGVALVLGLALLALAASWATAVSMDVVFSFPAAWMAHHRWVVVALAATVPASAAVYARAVL